MASVNTVRGPVDQAALGNTLTHEHVVVSSVEFARDYPELSWKGGRQAVLDDAVAKVQAVRDRGIETIVDCTVFFHGRDTQFVKEVNERVDIHIVASTGIYTYDFLPHFIKLRVPQSPERDILTRMFVLDITDGIGDTGVLAGNIKVATDKEGITPNNERMLRAVAATAVETGAPITTHTDAGTRVGLGQQKIFAEMGVDLASVIIGHSGDSTDLDYLMQLMDAGSTIGSDRFGLNGAGRATELQRLETIAELCRRGYADRIVLAHDSLIECDWLDSFDHYPDTWVPTHVSDVILPALLEHGVSQAQIDQMMIANPARVFGGTSA